MGPVGTYAELQRNNNNNHNSPERGTESKMYKPSYQQGSWYVIQDTGSLKVIITEIGTGEGCRQLAIERARDLNKDHLSECRRLANPIQLETLINLKVFESTIDIMECFVGHSMKDKIKDGIDDYIMNTKLEEMNSGTLENFECWLDRQHEIVGSDFDHAQREGLPCFDIDLQFHRILDLRDKIHFVIFDFERLPEENDEDEDPIEYIKVRKYTCSPNYVGYPLYYVWQGEAFCADCVNENVKEDAESGNHVDDCEWLGNEEIGNGNVNDEDPNLYCSQCSERIESAYAEPEEEEG